MKTQASEYESVITAHEKGFQFLIWTDIISGLVMLQNDSEGVEVINPKGLGDNSQRIKISQNKKTARTNQVWFFLYFFLLNNLM